VKAFTPTLLLAGVLIISFPHLMFSSAMPQSKGIEKFPNPINLEQDHAKTASILLIQRVVPLRFREKFIQYTENDEIKFRINLLGMAELESCGWTKMKSIHPNSDGTLDFGPLALNQRNIENPVFMNAYAPKEKIDDINVYYMITCINYFRDLYSSYGHDAIYVYNGGDRRYLRGTLKQQTLDYYKEVNENIDMFNTEYRNILTNERMLIAETEFINSVRSTASDDFVKEYTSLNSKINNDTMVFSVMKEFNKTPYIQEKQFKLPKPEYTITTDYKNTTNVLGKILRFSTTTT
jgi:hypothetical protein